MARRQPTAFITGAVIAGFALSRFLKSSGTTPFPTSGNTTDDAKSFSSTRSEPSKDFGHGSD